jgi:hypothetical protein
MRRNLAPLICWFHMKSRLVATSFWILVHQNTSHFVSFSSICPAERHPTIPDNFPSEVLLDGSLEKPSL